MPEPIDFQTMLTYMRPAGSVHERKFCNRYIVPVFGKSDKFGNYTKIIGDKPVVSFMAHYDTVHNKSGRSVVTLQDGFYSVSGANCLGADCTTGVYIILKMIEAKVPGVYVIHADEERGCIGSKHLVESAPDWFNHVQVAISFDRKGYESIVTHQMGVRTCSDDFASSLADMLYMDFKTDKGGVYTDSNEYADVISECTNLSVGYFSQHTSKEVQHKEFLEELIESLISANWDDLVVSRQSSDYEDIYEDYNYYLQSRGIRFEPKVIKSTLDHNNYRESREDETLEEMSEIIRKHTRVVAAILNDMGIDAYDLVDQIEDYKANISSSRGFW